LADSKLLTGKRREVVFAVIAKCAVAIGVGRSEVEEVERLNVYWAAMEARRRAVEALPTTPGHVLGYRADPWEPRGAIPEATRPGICLVP
jgi:ribonuclease HII